MKKRSLVAYATLLAILLFPRTSLATGSVTMCELNPANPSQGTDITVLNEDVRAHLQQGDFLGSCNSVDLTGTSEICFVPVAIPSLAFQMTVENRRLQAFFAQGSFMGPCGSQPHKLYICHIPPGNPGNAHTIDVARASVQLNSHLSHGDYPGHCRADGNNECEAESGCLHRMP